MDEIKQEILSLSEKYSIKCVESAALEEELQRVTSQLAQAQQHIMQLDARFVFSNPNFLKKSLILFLGISSYGLI